MNKLVEQKKLIIEEYLTYLGLSHEKQRIPAQNGIQWLFRFKDSSVFLMLFEEDGENFLWFEEAISEEESFSEELMLFMLKTQYSYLYPYRLAISGKGFIVVQYISPINRVCNQDFKLLLRDLIAFTDYVITELKDKFKLNSISFGEGTSTSAERKK